MILNFRQMIVYVLVMIFSQNPSLLCCIGQNVRSNSNFQPHHVIRYFFYA